MIPFWLGSVVKFVVLPPTGPLLVAIAGLAMLASRPRLGRALAVAGVLGVWLLATPAIGGLLVRCLDRTPALDIATARNVQAIVILGGGERAFAPEYGAPTLNSVTLERVRYGARLARATHLPVLVSGGSVSGRPPEALLMRDALVHEFSIPVRWVEARSRNTHENAIESARMLAQSGVSRVILVGHSSDFPRSRKEFEASGIGVVAAPIDIPRVVPAALGDFLPSWTGLRESYYACYEILANAAFAVTHAGEHAAAMEQHRAARLVVRTNQAGKPTPDAAFDR